MTNWRTAVISVLLSLWFNRAGFLAAPSVEPVIESGVEQPMNNNSFINKIFGIFDIDQNSNIVHISY